MARILLTLTLLCGTFSILLSQTALEGKVIDQGSTETIPFATVALYKNGVLITGTDTDFDGNYTFSNIDPGTYDVEAKFLGYATSRITGVQVNADKVNSLNFELQEEGEVLDEVIIVGYTVPLINIDETSQGGVLTADAIKALPTKNISAMAATTAGLSSVNGEDISIRGSRNNATYYYIDGVRVTGANAANLIPQTEIEQLQVVTGGIEAKYGDVTGGVISITTKGPSKNFTGGFELETSQFLDAFGYNLASANLSGPLVKNKAGESVLGFRLSGQYRLREDDRPAFTGHYRLSEDRIADLEADPLFTIGETSFPRADTLSLASVGDPLKAAPNEREIDYNVSLKVDARFSQNIDMTLSGGVFNNTDRFTPFSRTSRSNDRGEAWSLLNYTRNPYEYRDGYRANVRFRHKLGRQAYGQGEEGANTSLIQNAYYMLQFGVEESRVSNEDLIHEDNLFNYGYYGNTPRDWQPVASIVTGDPSPDDILLGGIPFRHQGYAPTIGEFQPNLDINPTLALINSASQLPQNGFNDPDYRDVWGIHHNVGQVYNRFFKGETDIYTLNVTSGFDIVPAGADKGKHNIQFGFMYEQRVRRVYDILPGSIWETARQAANRHIFGVDTSQVIGTFEQFGQTFNQYQTSIIPDDFPDLYFFRRVRELEGVDPSLNNYVNTDGLLPSQMSLDLFAPGELILDRNLDMNYFGYDYQGNKLPNNVTFDEFFTGVDENGVRTFNVAPLQPVYAAGYIQDRFKFRDIIFRAGVRVDYFDANTKVLKDEYSLYEIETADVFHTNNPDVGRASTIGDDYKVYLKDDGGTDVLAYRQDDQWFTPNGTAVNNPSALFSGSIITPSYKEKDDRLRDILTQDFDPNTSFEDYEAQFNVMPRLAFSFPISEEAGFFAHYDVLVQRPPSNTESTALNYYYFTSQQTRFSSEFDVAGNPNLKPEKTIDYEVGFQQKISNTSAIKVSAYYKELRDMIQRQIISNVPIVGNYETFGNIDFGTVKGFSFGYDLRRTGNLTLKANYTLQFANGSGSDANSGRGLNSRGIIRELFPFSYDERHRINLSLDYRYADGKAYTGPTIGGKDIFANAGANFIITAVSGRPYSLFSQVQQEYSQSGIVNINGSRLPWLFNTDVRLDKQLSFSFSEESKRSLNANVYLRFENLFNTRNIVDVYNVTQSADDDGYLLTSFGADRLSSIEQSGRDVDGFLASYQWRLLDPDFFAAPRRIYLGVIFDF